MAAAAILAVALIGVHVVTIGQQEVPAEAAAANYAGSLELNLIGVHVVTIGQQEVPAEAAAANYAGSLELNASGAELASWNRTSSFCHGTPWAVPDGRVSTDDAGNATLTMTGKPGSCVAIISPRAYASGVVEADIDFPAVPGKPTTLADWTSFWLTDQAHWPENGEIDAVEAEPLTGVNAVSYHWGTATKSLDMSTDGLAPDGKIPFTGPNLTPGSHVVDVVFTKGFFAVYYDGKQFASARSGVITGDALNVLLSSAVTPHTKAAEKGIGGQPKNSDSSPATMKIKYLRVWSYAG